MTSITLVSVQDYPIRSLIESALSNELRLLESSLRQTQARLTDFESRFQLNTEEFVRRYADDRISEDMETIEWLGEHRMAQRIKEKIVALRGIHFAH
jgi:hypothetical protein